MGTQRGWEPGCRAAGRWSKLSSALLAVVWALGDYFQLLLTHLRNVFPSASLVLGCLVLSLIPASKGHEGFSRWWQSSLAGSGAAEGPRICLVLFSSYSTISIVQSHSLVGRVGNSQKPRGASAEPPRKSRARSMWEMSLPPRDFMGTGAWSLSAAVFLLTDQPAGLKEPDINWSWTEPLKGWKQGSAGAPSRLPQELIHPHPRLFHPFPAPRISPALHCSWAQPSPWKKRGKTNPWELLLLLQELWAAAGECKECDGPTWGLLKLSTAMGTPYKNFFAINWITNCKKKV